MSLKSFEREIKLLLNNQNEESLFINNENLMHLSGTESGFEILEAFMKDLSKNISVIKAIINLLNNPNELSEIDIDINEIPLVKNGLLDSIKHLSSGNIAPAIQKLLLKEYFGEEEKEIIKLFEQYNSKKVLKIIYDVTDIFEFIKNTSHRVRTDKIAETILKEKHRRIEAWEENHYFDIYNNVYSGKIATVYMEKKDSTIIKRNEDNGLFEIQKNPKKLNIDDEFIELINSLKHIHAIEIDELTDIKKIKKVLMEMKEFTTTVDKTFYLKIRKLGKHKAAGLYYRDFDIIAIDLDNDYALAHEWTHHIHLNGAISREQEIKIYSEFNKYNDYLNESNIAYYSSVSEVIARAGEFSYALFKANFKEIFEAYQTSELYKGKKVTKNNFNSIIKKESKRNEMSWSIEQYASDSHSNVYFNFNNRTPEELLGFYTNFQEIFQYPEEIKREKNKEKADYNDYTQNVRSEKRRRRKVVYLKGIKSYRLKDILNILNEYKNDNINAMSKEDLLTAVLLSKDFSYSIQLIKTFKDKKWKDLYSEEEIIKITSTVIEELAKEGVNQYNIGIIKSLKSYIKEDMYDLFNIVNYDKEYSEEEIKKMYGMQKEGLLIVKSVPKGSSTEDFKKYLDFFNKINKVGNSNRVSEVEIKKEFNIQKDGAINSSTEYGKLNQILIAMDETHYYLPTGEGEAYQIPKSQTPNYSTIDTKTLLETHKDNGKNIIIISKEENPEEIKKYNSRYSANNLIYLDKISGNSYTFKESRIKKVKYEIKENKLIVDGIEKKVTFIEKPPSSYSSHKIEYKIKENNKVVKKYNEPELGLSITDLFPDGVSEYLLEDGMKIEDLSKKLFYIYETLSNNKTGTILSPAVLKQIYIKYGINGIKEVYKVNALNLLKGRDFQKNIIDSNEDKLFFDYLVTSGTGYSLKYADLSSFIIPSKDISELIDFVKEMSDYNIKMEIMQRAILSLLSTNKDTEEIEKRMPIFKKDIESKTMMLAMKTYKLVKDKSMIILKDKIETFWKYLQSKQDTKDQEKISFQDIKIELKKYDFEDKSLEEAKNLILEKFNKSTAKKTLNDLIKEFKSNLRTSISTEYNIGIKNIFDYLDNNRSFNKATKQALKPNDHKYIYENTSFERILELKNMIKKYNEEKKIDLSDIRPYNEGFGFLEKSLNELIENKEKFKTIKLKKDEEIIDKEKEEKNVLSIIASNKKSEKIMSEPKVETLNELGKDAIYTKIETIIFKLEKVIDDEKILKLNINSKLHKQRLFSGLETIMNTKFENNESFIEWAEKNINRDNLKYLRSFISKYELESQREFRNSDNLNKKNAYIKNLISIKMKTLISVLAKKVSKHKKKRQELIKS